MKTLISNMTTIFPQKNVKFFLTVLCVPILSCIPTGEVNSANAPSIAPQLQEWQTLTAPKNINFPARRYADFLQRNSQPWPLHNRILWRYQNALIRDDSTTDRPHLCPSLPITQWPTLDVCAPYLKDLAAHAQSLWKTSSGNESDEPSFLQHYQKFLTPSDHWQRYVYLEKIHSKKRAQSQIDRLSPSNKNQARARFAYRFYQPDADSLLAQAPQPNEPSLLLLRLQYLRHQARYDDALSLWRESGDTTEQKVLSSDKNTWINERLTLARALLRQPYSDNPSKALQLIKIQPRPTLSFTEQEERLLGAYIHLVLLNDPVNASSTLEPLLNASTLSIRASAIYWNARCEDAQNHKDRAQQLYKQASNYPTTFYGQLALAALTNTAFLTQSERPIAFSTLLKQRLNTLPAVATGAIARTDLAQAARILHKQGDEENATIFLNFIQGRTQSPADQKAIADLAASLHIPQPAILAARALGRRGIAFFPEGYPRPLQLADLASEKLPSGLVAALIRQESSANPYSMSPRNAVGLMQLLPATARLTARRHQVSIPSLNTQTLLNPSINLTLGQLFLQELTERFNGTLPYVLAAYNAGPGRVRQWNNDVLSSLSHQTHNVTADDQLLHWLVTLPFKETRTYVEHIETDMSLYAVLPTQ